MDEKPQTRSLLTEGILIAGFPIVAYLHAFLYELSYAKYFGMPVEFISLDLTSIFIVGVTVLGWVMIFVLSLVLLLAFVKISPTFRKSPRITLFGLLFGMVSVGLIALLFFKSLWDVTAPLAIMMVLIITLIMVSLPKLDNTTNIQSREKLFNRVARSLQEVVTERRIAQILIIFTLALLITYGRGHARAVNQSDFLVPSAYPEMVVLRIYGDKMICAKYSKDTKLVQRSFAIIEQSQTPYMELKYEKIGPLIPTGQ